MLDQLLGISHRELDGRPVMVRGARLGLLEPCAQLGDGGERILAHGYSPQTDPGNREKFSSSIAKKSHTKKVCFILERD